MRVLNWRHTRRTVVLLALALLLVIVVLFSSARLAAGGTTVSAPNSAVMTTLLQKTNDLRRVKGLDTLRPSAELERSALAKGTDMVAGRYWAHRSPDGTSFSAYIWDELPNATIVGENLAHCYASHDDAFTALVNSPTHYAVLTGDFVSLGVASVIDNNGCESIVMHFSS